ncbi:MAG: alpha/beta fold hydrolase [Acidobacteriota bacterium]|nr:alpha/beta fold hydrolase [Acidobacteriota bacterium]
MSETVILLHGLGRTPASMVPLAIAARRRGYDVINWHYRSRTRTIGENAEALARALVPRVASASRVHFVTHSLGGIIVRQFLAKHSLPNLGRVVMLAPPNGGSEVADVMQRWLRPVKAVQELGTGAASVPRALPRVDYAVGVIAGSRSHIPLFSHWMDDAPNDGVVAVERTRVDGMHDFLVLHRTHTFLPWAPDAIAQAMHFLERGRFN